MTVNPDRANLVLELFETYYKRVFCFTRKSLANAAAEDIAQEVFTRLLQVKNLEEKTITSSYLIKIADNLIKRRYNKDQRSNAYIESQREEAVRDLRRNQKVEPEWSNTFFLLTFYHPPVRTEAEVYANVSVWHWLIVYKYLLTKQVKTNQNCRY